MHPKHLGPAERPEKRGHIRDLWSKRPLAGWAKSAANKLLSRRLERRRLNRLAKAAALAATRSGSAEGDGE